MSIEMQELFCRNCGGYVQFPLDLELNGNHVLKCPNCGHEHCRVVKDGIITDQRWDSRNPSNTITASTYSISPRYVTFTSYSFSSSSSTWSSYTTSTF